MARINPTSYPIGETNALARFDLSRINPLRDELRTLTDCRNPARAYYAEVGRADYDAVFAHLMEIGKLHREATTPRDFGLNFFMGTTRADARQYEQVHDLIKLFDLTWEKVVISYRQIPIAVWRRKDSVA